MRSAPPRFLLIPAALLPVLLSCTDTSEVAFSGYLTQALAVADVSGDGRADVVSVHAAWDHDVPQAGFMTTRAQGTTPGTFAEPVRVATGIHPIAVALGDLNGDARPDAAVANHDLAGTAYEVGLHLQSATEPGTFLPAQALVLGARRPCDVVVADLNGDGRADVAIAADGADSALVAYQSATPGTFGPLVPLGTGAVPRALVAADLNGDGRTDLAVATRDHRVSVLLQDGAGGFLPSASFLAGADPVQVRAGDLNGDGRVDLAVACYSQGTNGMVVLLQDAAPGSFGAPMALDARDFATAAVAVADLDGDGRLDLAVANEGLPGDPGSVAVLLQDPANPGMFLMATRYQGYFGPCCISAGDLDGDGRLDLAVADGGTLVRFQDPANPGYFQPPVQLRP